MGRQDGRASLKNYSRGKRKMLSQQGRDIHFFKVVMQSLQSERRGCIIEETKGRERNMADKIMNAALETVDIKRK